MWLVCKYPGAQVSDAHGEHTCLLTQHLHSEGRAGQKVVRPQRTGEGPGAAWVPTLWLIPRRDVDESTRASP